ncbi:MAG: hemerythrin domain-containing protein [Nonomuraea sp.]|nr:hemerythrin domain-containing protein [Nonomuraea sp.]NUP65145.1 hemerythrin domain-containing protein [Nonomuraea sp.]NUR88383.1 hemerythrin domain-containing protein [Nonomuraea sp.]NUS06082.1 hemerythrin domain-containing protein [Nonomuraea sp.]NUT42104.1 hemerythrin domain-containing protein [Thermoactinospora sp.]
MATDVITLITNDHRTVESLFERLKKGQGDLSATVAELHALLTAHARAEEDRVYPGIDAHHGVEEHKEAEVLLDSLVRAKPGTAEFAEALDKLAESVDHHVQEEETTLLPKLARTASEAKLRELGQAFKERRAEELRALTATGDGPTKAELYEQAQKADIPGRSQMDKDELQQALRQAKS